MKKYDCFIFNHEVELLEIRFNILNDYVDKFIITEGDITFSGLPKESHYLKNKDRFKTSLPSDKFLEIFSVTSGTSK